MWVLGVRKKFPSRYDLLALVASVMLSGGAPVRADDEMFAPAPVPEQPVATQQAPLPSQPPAFTPLFEGQTAENTYINEKGDQVVFSVNGKVATREDFIDDAKRRGTEFKMNSRQWIGDAVKAEGVSTDGDLSLSVHDDVKVSGAISGTLESQRRLERLVDDDLAKAEAEAKRLTPVRTLISTESGRKEVSAGGESR